MPFPYPKIMARERCNYCPINCRERALPCPDGGLNFRLIIARLIQHNIFVSKCNILIDSIHTSAKVHTSQVNFASLRVRM